ncbi:Hypothetical protein P9303_25871 [Prochlorococcus marinus str. MIT 9303]|uniref:Uncharacterized protein n=1 Tax=Prochlorococcus marinus (strain MIT 9303) TaxID=59922 RepID=A2CCV8_PROM3|nr:Hypothetical protein P9303_25871 [Prochlorococcus marinus str. MIT 9303]
MITGGGFLFQLMTRSFPVINISADQIGSVPMSDQPLQNLEKQKLQGALQKVFQP